MNAATQTVPVERIVDGVGRQVVNQYIDGQFNRQVSYYGTEDKARAYAALLTMHDTHPEYAATVARLRGSAA